MEKIYSVEGTIKSFPGNGERVLVMHNNGSELMMIAPALLASLTKLTGQLELSITETIIEGDSEAKTYTKAVKKITGISEVVRA